MPCRTIYDLLNSKCKYNCRLVFSNLFRSVSKLFLHTFARRNSSINQNYRLAAETEIKNDVRQTQQRYHFRWTRYRNRNNVNPETGRPHSGLHFVRKAQFSPSRQTEHITNKQDIWIMKPDGVDLHAKQGGTHGCKMSNERIEIPKWQVR